MTHMGSKIGSPPYIVCMEEEEMSSDSEVSPADKFFRVYQAKENKYIYLE